MINRDDFHRTAAACERCGATYAARKFSDGSIRLIGRSNECRCGGREFVDLSEAERPNGSGRTATD
ncbi:hypothetical protein [Salinilacihabitans rarus]|uniref:hypothetical protein n=1 Tax=Salinilacihabitans rarus TaxID=2961596 RepID=UPI0020C8AA55|nr:hypothetical protein [Salinilacihabitans rarus]